MNHNTLPRPASTLLLLREQDTGLEVYLVKRHGRSGFMASAHVFPGGRVDEEDRTFVSHLTEGSRRQCHDLLDHATDVATAVAFAIAAIRETAEECGVLLARDPAGGPVAASAARDVVSALRQGASFGALLRERSWEPDVGALAPFAWWITPTAEPRRFDTRFFVAPLPDGQEPAADQQETTEGAWYAPATALAAYAAGDIFLAPPTLATLEDIRGAQHLQDARAQALRPLRPVCPELLHDDDGSLLLALPGDPRHPISERAQRASRTRIVMGADGRFCSKVASHGAPPA